jgi:isocitrate dehydrogenase (NAD+)
MTQTIAYIPGLLAEHHGEETLPNLLKAAGAELNWTHVPWNPSDPPISALSGYNAILMAHQTPFEQGPPPIVQLREHFQCFANLRPVVGFPGLNARFDDIDLLVVRESTEDIYAQLEHESIPGVFESLKVTTRSACERIAQFAFETAIQHGRKKVTIVHKANIMKKSDGMFLATARDIASKYPQIEVDDCIVDALCMKLILHPEWFDVLLCGNLFGDIVSDLGAGLVGGRANCPSANIGAETAIFTTGHRAQGPNDSSLLLSAVLMLRHLGQTTAAETLLSACAKALHAPKNGLIVDVKATL